MRERLPLLLAVAALLRGQSDLLEVSPRRSVALPAKAEAIVYSPDGRKLAVAAGSGVAVLDLDAGAPVTIPACPRGRVTALAAARDGVTLAAACEDGTITLGSWTGLAPAPLRPHRREVSAIDFSPDGSLLVAAGKDRAAVLLDVAGRREVAKLDPGTGKPLVFAGFTRAGATVVAVTESGQIAEWDTKTSRLLRKLELADNTIFAAAINGGGTLLALGSEFARLNKGSLFGPVNPADFYRENRLILYDLSRGAEVKRIDGVDGQLRSLSFSGDNRYLAAARQRIKRTYFTVFDLERGAEIYGAETLDRSALAAFSPTGQSMASLTAEGQLALFQVRGVGLAADAGNLAGARIRSTSPSQTPLLPPGTKVTLAVMDLDPLRVDKDLGRSVAEMLRNRIVGGGVEVVAYDRMQEILRQQNFQLSDRTDSLTAVALGRILNAGKTLFGSLSRLGGTYTLNVQLVDVETARVEGVREILCQRCAEEDLPSAVAEMRPLLVGNP